MSESDQIKIVKRMRRAVINDENFGEKKEATIYYSTLSRNEGQEYGNLLDLMENSNSIILLKEITWLLINLCIMNKTVVDILEPIINIIPKTMNTMLKINQIISHLIK